MRRELRKEDEIEHLQLAAEFLQHHFRRVAVIAGLVLPFAGLQLTLDIDLHALLQVLLGDLGEIVVEDHDVMPLGLFLALAGILVAPAFGCGDPDVDHRVTGVQPPDFRVGAQIPDQNDLVYATRHHTLSALIRNQLRLEGRTVADQHSFRALPEMKCHPIHK